MSLQRNPALAGAGQLSVAGPYYIYVTPEEQHGLRSLFNLGGAILKLLLIVYLLWGVMQGEEFIFRYTVLPGLDLVLKADALAMLFVTLSAALWFLTTLYAIGYLEGSPHRSRFFGFFSLCVTATVGVAMAGNLFTLFRLLRTADPLHLPSDSASRHRAGNACWNIYLAYTLGGGALLLIGTVWLYALAGQVEFTQGGVASGSGNGPTPPSCRSSSFFSYPGWG